MQQEYTSLVYGQGKTTIPKAVRKLLNVDDGSRVVYTVSGNSVIVSSEDALAATLKKMVTKATSGKSLVAELISDRRAAAKHE